MKQDTREMWLSRVREWQESGLTSEAFAEGKGFKGSTLRRHRSRLVGVGVGAGQRGLRSGEKGGRMTRETPRFVPVRVVKGDAETVTDIVVEVGAARIRVGRGVDLSLVGNLVRVLQEVDR